MRKTRQGGSRLTLAVIDDDRLDDAQTATAAAISALKKATVPGNAGIGVGRRLEAKPKMVGREWAYGRAVEESAHNCVCIGDSESPRTRHG